MLQPSPETFSAHPASQWTGAVKVRFLECLAQKGNVRLACAQVGLSAETAYRQRRRDPAFARGWNAATALARRCAEQVLADRALDGIEEEVWYRGELTGTRRRYDSRLLLAHLGRLDRLVEENTTAGPDADRFDELLAVLAGAELPAELADEDGLPVCRETAVEMAIDEARKAEFDKLPEDDPSDFGRPRHPDELEERDRIAVAAKRAGERAAVEAERKFDAWLAAAHAAADAALDDRAEACVETGVATEEPAEPESSPGTLSTASTPARKGSPFPVGQTTPRSPFQSERRR